MSREWWQRRRMLLAWLLIALLACFLVLREGLGYWRELAQWRALAESAVGMRTGPTLSLERLRQSAQARRVELLEVQAQDEGWQVRGKVGDAQSLLDWLQALRTEGARLVQWGLSREGDGLRFDVQVQP
ncbi:type II secretion system protein GspM [Pseudomonas entomophila]|uniref:Type II secretion system protein GspM n=2 Tax=Pseudomonas entomophila TaxID=312306 RepID=A0ABY9QUG6_9PSED|nr:type II secretion system protein GspM [Pseudomonas entomophila]WMW07311.1 type II secretion system protein GspM [Pseudomonas entomophila]CAK16960.1 putative type II secretion system protein M [Pseudomonas entomophila L48]